MKVYKITIVRIERTLLKVPFFFDKTFMSFYVFLTFIKKGTNKVPLLRLFIIIFLVE